MNRWGRSLDFSILISVRFTNQWFCWMVEEAKKKSGKWKAESRKLKGSRDGFAVGRDLTDRLTYFCALHPSVQDQTAPAFAGRGDAQGGHRVAVREDSRGF